MLGPRGQITCRLEVFPGQTGGRGVQIVEQRLERLPAGGQARLGECVRECLLSPLERFSNFSCQVLDDRLLYRSVGHEHDRKGGAVVALEW